MSIQVNSKYTQYLPRIFQKGSDETDNGYFLGRFLMAFEQILTGGTEKKETVGIEELLGSFELYFDPNQAPPQFLQWLAGWVALTLEEGTDFYGEEDKNQKNAVPPQILPLPQDRTTINRKLIGAMVQLYKKRGTLNGLLEYLQLYAGEETTIAIDEFLDTARLGNSRVIGLNTMVGGSSPSFFAVHAIIPAQNRSTLNSKVELLRRVIESEKPFHTNYLFNVEVPAMRVGVYSKIGRETLIGGMVED